MNLNKTDIIFRRLGLWTVVSVYFLILVGGIVRSTGSGMGCPDWPKCFGTWLPPSEVSELPDNYKEVYAEKRRVKNVKLASLLDKLGFNELAYKISTDKQIYQEQDFNPVKTKIEYINRLVGVVIGLLVFAVVVASWPYLKSDKWIFYLSFLSFVLVGFEGWFGSILVSTNLVPFAITIHMILALLLVCVLTYTVVRSQKEHHVQIKTTNSVRIKRLNILFLSLIFIQIILGTQVRENIDDIGLQLGGERRSEWISETGVEFLIHRSFSVLLLAIAVLLASQVIKNTDEGSIVRRGVVVVAGLIVLEIFTGVILNYLGFPAFIQPVHLVLGTMIFGIQYWFFILHNFSNKEVKTGAYEVV